MIVLDLRISRGVYNMYDVLADVPLPKVSRPWPSSRRKYPFFTMEVGGMFFVPHRNKNNLTAHASAVGRRIGRKFSTRMIYMRKTGDQWIACGKDDDGAVLGIGVWRMK